MAKYQIEQTATATILWTGKAASEQAALDAMAQNAGYRDHADACYILHGDAYATPEVTGIEVRALECMGHPAGTTGVMGETNYCDGSCR